MWPSENSFKTLCVSHHVIVESSSIGVYKWNKFLHCSIQRLQQLPHLGVKVTKLLVAVGEKADHCTKRCTLRHNNGKLESLTRHETSSTVCRRLYSNGSSICYPL